MLNLPFRNEAHYFSSLPAKTAAYLKRKFRPLEKLKIEYRTSIAGLEAEINELYKATLAQSPVDYGEFGHVHERYFTQLLAQMGEDVRFMLCWLDGELLSFQSFVVGERDIVAKCIGMRYPQAKDHNLYFINWLMMIRFALEHDKSRICMGGTTYHTKSLFGGVMEKRWIYFRFRNPILNKVLPWLAPAFDFEKNDPELQALAAQQAKAASGDDSHSKQAQPKQQVASPPKPGKARTEKSKTARSETGTPKAGKSESGDCAPGLPGH